jgi:hypothetical protein
VISVRPRPGRICSDAVPLMQQPGQRRGVAAAGAAGQHQHGIAGPDRAVGLGQQHPVLGCACHGTGEPGRRRKGDQRQHAAEQGACHRPTPRHHLAPGGRDGARGVET